MRRSRPRSSGCAPGTASRSSTTRIRSASEIPFLFDGRLPDLNVGTNEGASCAPQVERVVMHGVRDAVGYTWVLNGRFKGGWTTRHYGRPADGVHAVQMELAQATYLAAEAPPWDYDPTRAERLRVHLTDLLATLAQAADDLKVSR